MLASLLPVGVAPVEAAGENAGGAKAASNQQFDALINMDNKKPVDFDPNSTENPYGYPKDQPFLLNAENELMLYHNKNGFHQINVYDQWQGGQGKDFKLDLNGNGEQGGFKDRPVHKSAKSYAFAEGVAFDPNGTGRKDHVAYVGYDDNSIVVWVVNPKTGHDIAQTRIPMTKGANNWIKKDWEQGDGHLYQYNASNFFAITAGNYDGSFKDEIVVYAPNDGHNYNLYQFRLEGNSLRQLATSRNQLHEKYEREDFGNQMANSTLAQNKLSCDLETGDFDGDGIDDLAVLSYINNPYNDTREGLNWNELDKAYYWPWLKIAYGGHSDPNQGVLNSHSQSPFTYVRQNITDNANTQKYNTMLVPGMSAGDTDGDGKDEIVVAGLKDVITCKENSNDTYDNMEIYSNKMAIAVFNGEGNLGDIDQKTARFSEVDSNAWTSFGFYDSTWNSWQQAGVECVAFNGPAAAEHAFINGTVYDLSSDQPTAVYTPKYFNEKDNAVESVSQPASFIASTTVGNFEVSDPKPGSKNKAGQEQYGYEQIAFVVGLTHPTTGKSYYYFTGLIGGANYNKDGGPVGSIGGTDNTQFYDTLNTEDGSANYDYIINGESESLDNNNLNCSVVAVDTDDDGNMAKYVGKMYAYSDPQVVAVLQAAPYFHELGDDYLGDNYGETTYEFTHEYEYTEGEGRSTSFGIGVTTSAETAFGGIDATLGSANNWSKSFEKSLITTTTDSFSAQGYDSVVLSRTPVFIYNYQFQDKKTGEWNSEELLTSITVPRKPSYVQMSTTDYNNFVNVYNKKLPPTIEVDGKIEETKKMKPLPETLTWLGQRGNPWGYSNGLEKISKGSYELGYNGGTMSSTHADGTASSEIVETEHGFNFDFAITFGFQLAGNGVQAGPAISLEHMKTKSTTKTNSDTKATSGTVADIDSEALMKQYGLPEKVIKSYGFTWELGKAVCDLGVAGDKSLIIGYNVRDIKAPAPSVTDLNAEPLTDSSVKLNWSDPKKNNRLRVDGYNVYKKKKNGKFEKLTSEPIKDTSYTVKNLTSNEEYTFAVTTYNQEVGESVWSNRIELTTPKKNMPLTMKYNPEMVEVKATHTGNIQINNGDNVPEKTIVSIEAKALGDNTITEITKKEGKKPPEKIIPVDGKFSFFMKEATEIEIKAEPISYNSLVTLKQPDSGGTFSATYSDGLPVYSGSEVTEPLILKAIPQEGFALKQWLIDEETYEANGKDTMTFKPSKESHTISAEFVSVNDASVARTITIDPIISGGTLIVKDENGNELQPDQNHKINLLSGAKVSITATPDDYYKISKWTGALSSQSAKTDTVQLEVLESMQIGVEFAPRIQFNVAFEGDEKGNITAKMGQQALTGPTVKVNPGSIIDFEASAISGYRVRGWTIQRDGRENEEIVLDTLQTTANYQLQNVLTPTNVKANFAEIQEYNINFGSGSGTGHMDSKKATEMTPFTLPEPAATLVAPEDQEFKCWKIGDQEFKPGDPYTFTGDTTVTAQWKSLPKHQITFVAGDGKGDAITQEAVHNKQFALPSMPEGFVAPEDMEFAGWKIGETIYQVGASVQFTDGTTVTAQWKPLPKFTITFQPGAGKGEETTQEVVVNKKFALPNVPASFNAPSGKVFDCWKIGDKTYAVGDTVQFSQAATVIAQWKNQPSGGGVLPKPPVKPDVPDSEVLPDGTTVETETKPDGTKIETTTKADGSQNIKETKPDGSSKTTINNKDGSQSTTTESPEGLMETKVQIPKELAEKAAEKKENIILPMPQAKVPSAQDKTPIINIDLGTKTKTNVVIPAESIPPGAVAYIVNEDGTKEVIRKSGISKDGIVVPVEGKTTIMICDNAQEFNDLDGHWGENAAAFASSHELFNGTGNGQFSPDASMTRGMVATVLHNLENNPQSSAESNFVDVDKDAWYADGINWAAEKGIVAGTSEGNFSPNESVTREQLAVMLYRYAGEPEVTDQQMSFQDANTISDFAKDAMNWATQQGIMKGTNQGMLNPQGTATRAEVATMLMNFVNGMK